MLSKMAFQAADTLLSGSDVPEARSRGVPIWKVRVGDRHASGSVRNAPAWTGGRPQRRDSGMDKA